MTERGEEGGEEKGAKDRMGNVRMYETKEYIFWFFSSSQQIPVIVISSQRKYYIKINNLQPN